MQVRLLTKTAGVTGTEYSEHPIDGIVIGIARISSSRDTNTLFDNPSRLLRHCLLNGHWSIFEMANLTFEIKASRAIGRELLRQCKLTGVQEYSQRYAEATTFEPVELRRQSRSNRQSSTERVGFITEDTFGIEIDPTQEVRLSEAIEDGYLALDKSLYSYERLLEWGVAKECARFVLPETTQTTLIMNFRIRELITMLNVRLHKTAQKEVRLVAESMRDIFIQECPLISAALHNFANAYEIHILDQLVLEKHGFKSEAVVNN